jgi:hypothetical protein
LYDYSLRVGKVAQASEYLQLGIPVEEAALLESNVAQVRSFCNLEVFPMGI